MSKLKYYTKLFARSFAFFENQKAKYILGLFLGAFELGLLFATPYINEALMEIVTGQSDANIVHMVAMLFVVFLAFVPPVIIGKYLQNTTTVRATENLRNATFKHIMEVPYSALLKLKTGDYITRITDDVTKTGKVYSSFAFNCLVRFIVVFSVTLVILLMSDPRLALVGIIYGIISLVLSVVLNPYAKSLEKEAKIEIVNSASSLIEAMRGIPIIRVFTLHEVLAEKYLNICKIIKSKRSKYRTVIGITYGVIDFFTFSAQPVAFIIAILISINQVDVVSAVFSATIVGLMADSMLRLSTFLLLVQPSLVSMERVFDVLDLPTEELGVAKESINTNTEYAVEFSDVSFSYNEDKKVINNLSLAIKNGEHLAIVGGSGGGKSTLIKLIARFYEPQSGSVKLFEKSSNDLTIADTRMLSSYIAQECSLFEGSIKENILLGKTNASESEVINAAKRANIHDFIMSLPEKYDTAIGERGSRLSGGQKQRLAISRAIIKGAPIMLLDEATAALDSKTEEDIVANLNEITKGITTVTVAHRLSSVRAADRIIVMDSGKIVEEGTFDKLLLKGGKFKELYDKQFREE